MRLSSTFSFSFNYFLCLSYTPIKQIGRAPYYTYFIIHYITDFIQAHTLFFILSWYLFHHFSLLHHFICSYFPCFYFFSFCQMCHGNPSLPFLLLPFHSLALPPYISNISLMAYSNWNLPFSQDKKPSVSPKHCTINLKCDSLPCWVSITFLMLYYI